MKKIEFTKAKRSDIDEIVDMFRYTIKEMNANGIPQCALVAMQATYCHSEVSNSTT